MMNRTLFCTALLLITRALPCSVPAAHSLRTAGSWYAATQGTPSGEGTVTSPWDLATALAGGPSGSTVLPGDTIWVRGGTYAGSFRCALRGTEAAPIVVRSYAGERVVLDNGRAAGDTLWVPEDRAYVWFWGLEFSDSDPVRLTPSSGDEPPIHRSQYSTINVFGPGVKLINCVAHDGGNGIGLWSNSSSWGKARNAEVYGCLLFNNGWYSSTGGTGHGIIGQNFHSDTEPSQVRIRDSMFWNNFGYGVQLYAEDELAVLNRLWVEGVVSFNNGSPAGAYEGSPLRSPNLMAASTRRVQELTIRSCYLYHPPVTSGEVDLTNLLVGYENTVNTGLTLESCILGGGGLQAWLKGWKGAGVTRNLFASAGIGARLVRVETQDHHLPTDYLWNDNTYLDATPPQSNGERYTFRCDGVGDWNVEGQMAGELRFSAWRSGTGFDGGSAYAPASGTGLPNRVVVRPNSYEAGRAHVVVYNWERRASVAVDLSATGLTNDQAFEIRNVQNYFGAPVMTGTYTAGNPVVTLPLTDTAVAPPVGFDRYPIPSTLPEFGAFVLLPK